MRRTIVLTISFLMIFGFLSLGWADPGNKDTVRVDYLYYVPANTETTVGVYMYNDEDLAAWGIPLIFDDPTNTDIVCDSLVYSSRLPSGAITVDPSIDSTNNKLRFCFITIFGPYYLPVSGDSAELAGTIYFTTGPNWDDTDPVKLDTAKWPPATILELVDLFALQIIPEFCRGALEVKDVPQASIPENYSLSQNYPNPFNASTVIRFSLKQDTEVNLVVYNTLGQKVATLIEDRPMTHGSYEVTWDASRVSSGIYFYRIKADDFTEVKKMVLLK